MMLVQDEKTEAAPYPVYSSQTKNNGLSGFYSEYLFSDAITWTTDGANAGDVNYRTGKFFCTNVCGVLLNSKGFANSCIAELINSVARKYVSYVGNPKLMNGVMSKIPIPVPCLPEQQKIAECLSSVDELTAARARNVDALKTHKKGLMQQLFPREGETQPRLRFPEFQNAGEWEVSELGSLSDVRDGTHDSPSFFQTGRPLVTSKNLRSDGTLDLENVSLISEEDYEQINKRSKVSVGDILFGMIGTIGNPVLIKSEGFAIKNVALIKEVGPLSNAFLVQLLQSGYVAAIFAVLNTGNSQKFIALGKIRGLPVPVPSLPEQQRIATCLGSLDALITAETQKHEALKTHKKGLMQQLFPSPEEQNAL
jgi:type I restriction enzyme S subunit